MNLVICVYSTTVMYSESIQYMTVILRSASVNLGGVIFISGFISIKFFGLSCSELTVELFNKRLKSSGEFKLFLLPVAFEFDYSSDSLLPAFTK